MGRDVSWRNKDGVTVITGLDEGSVFAGASTTKRKLTVRNVGSVVLSPASIVITQRESSDGHLFAKTAADSATLGAPHNFAAVLAATGGTWGSTGIRFYRITAFNGTGETGPSQEVSVNVDDVNKSVDLSWTIIAGATGYKIYRGTASQNYGSTALLTTINNGATSAFNDDGSATTSGSVPTENTTAGGSPNYGTPPGDGSFAQTPISVGTLDLGEEAFFWMKADPAAGLTEDANPRKFNLEVSES